MFDTLHHMMSSVQGEITTRVVDLTLVLEMVESDLAKSRITP